jgi:hypothetical protein
MWGLSWSRSAQGEAGVDVDQCVWSDIECNEARWD